MKRLPYIAVLFWGILMTACMTVPATTGGKEKGFLSVPPELAGVDWKRTPEAVLSNPVKDEPLIWLGIVRKVDVTQRDKKIEIAWYCEHLSFVEAGPPAIGKRPIKAKEGKGFFALSLILDDMSIEQALKFKKEHTASPHYALVGGKFDAVIEREGRPIPFLYTLRFGMGPNLAVIEDTK